MFKYFSAMFIFISSLSWGLPRVTVTFNETPTGFTQVKIKNETTISLACFVAIDGFKKKFQLRAKSKSQWITASDTRYNYKNFSTWCDYLDIHPAYKAYQAY